MFLSKNKKIMYTPVNPSFIIYKWGLRGSKFYRRVFVMFMTRKEKENRYTFRGDNSIIVLPNKKHIVKGMNLVPLVNSFLLE